MNWHSSVRIVIMIACTASVNLVAQSGTVVDCCGKPVAGAIVATSPSGFSGTTDALGAFTLTGVSEPAKTFETYATPNGAAEVFDLRGRRISTSAKPSRRARFDVRKKTASCVVIQSTGANRQTVMTKIVVAGDLDVIMPESRRSDGRFGKKTAATDSLLIRATGFQARSVPANPGESIGYVYLVKINDPSFDCGAIRMLSDSAVSFGIGVMNDTFRLSGAGFEWSASGLQVAPAGRKFRCLFDAKPCGFYSRYSVTGMAGSYSGKVDGYAGYAGLTLLKNVLTKNDHIGGLILTEGASIDTTSYVVMYMGYVMGPKRTVLLNIPQRLEVRPSLPFDSTLLLTYFSVLQTEYVSNFMDSSFAQPKTVTAGGRSSPIIINAPVNINESISGTSIISSATVNIQTPAVLSGCGIMAAEIVIESGVTEGCFLYSTGKISIRDGRHNSHFLANDSIIVGKTVQTGPASVWISLKTERNAACIFFERNQSLRGTAISLKDGIWKSYSPSIHLDSGSVFSGYLVTDVDLSMKFVDITGSIYANSIVTSHNGTNYTDYLVGVTLHAPEKPFLFPVIGKDQTEIMLVQTDTTTDCY